ncbi:alpha/beta fold hydrolase [Roseateles amylovorans]|uniref:Alpha/beta hydrolase n=1 Tax=Roseateles amylovorans TaxID=2978473 RepID=A0ABY6B4U4_9BURK|nr:alpha/beta hydrolase [Roseateles amylovorans]UXH79954.1 alpha/beta hydrolase [Roseateles amylovorans]
MAYRFLRRTVLQLVLLLAVAAPPAFAWDRSSVVTAPDGVTLAVQETGDPEGPTVIFVHGLLGSRLSWDAQWRDPALQRFRLIAFDLRGHGQSGMPTSPQMYREGRRWGDDLDAVIRATRANRPVLVGWSLGAAVITNYLAAYGDDAIAGVIYAGGVIELKTDQLMPQPTVYERMASADLRTHLDGERAFLALCSHRPPDADTFQRMIAAAAMASNVMQNAVHGMNVEADKGLRALRKPILHVYGAHDALVRPEASFARAAALAPQGVLRLYPEAGHAPFAEDPARFDKDLATFIEAATR